MNIAIIIIYIMVILFAFLYRKSNYTFVFVFLMAWILIAGNYNNADYENYIWRYTSGHDLILDFGFSLLIRLFVSIGLDYQGFKAVLSFVCLLLIFNSIRIFCREKAFGAALFLIFPLVIDVTQFRNFVSYSFVYAALPFLFQKSKISLYAYIALVLFAATIHASSFFYLAFVFTRFKMSWWKTLIGVVAVYLLHDYMVSSFSQGFDTEKLNFTVRVSVLGKIFLSLQVIANAALIWYVHSKQKVKYDKNSLLGAFSSSDIWVYANMLTILIIPFLWDNGNYSRLFRNLLLINLLYVNNAYYIKRIVRYVIIGTYIVYHAYTNYFAGVYYELVFKPIFTFNDYLPSFFSEL